MHVTIYLLNSRFELVWIDVDVFVGLFSYAHVDLLLIIDLLIYLQTPSKISDGRPPAALRDVRIRIGYGHPTH